MRAHHLSSLALSFMFLLLSLPACDEAGAPGESGAFTMGATGGKVALSDGAEVSVPAGALQSAVSIGIANLGESAFPATNFTPVGDFYRLTPAGQKFKQPVKVVLPYNAGLVGSQGSNVRIFMSSNEGVTFEPLPLFSSSKPNSVGGQTLHFSIAVAGLPVSSAGTGLTNPSQPNPETEGGTTSFHDGCSSVTSPGCGGCPCEEAVCNLTPACCSATWGNSCAQLCAQLGGDCQSVPTEEEQDAGTGTEDIEQPQPDGTTPPSDSCDGFCGQQAPSGCFCDAACIEKGDCCADSCEFCEVCETGCGNSACESGETCLSCPKDCGPCADVCGDGTCGTTETCESCALDCCNPYCGDGSCNGGETCTNCPGDCGECGDEGGTTGSCVDKCGQPGAVDGCFCDTTCLTFDDCCDDACALCNVCP